MADQRPLYQMFNLRPSAAQSSADALASALCCKLLPGQNFGQNHMLDPIYAQLSQCPEEAVLHLCLYYFDQVTLSLPTRDQVKHMESCNLTLRCFDSWADLEKERRRAAEAKRGTLHPGSNQEVQPRAGIYLSRLSQLQDSNAICTKQYLYMMYGSRC